jgi:hypothetical protein
MKINYGDVVNTTNRQTGELEDGIISKITPSSMTNAYEYNVSFVDGDFGYNYSEDSLEVVEYCKVRVKL